MAINTTALREYLAWFAENVPENQFSFDHFKIATDGYLRFNNHDQSIMMRVKGNTCGSVGCIMGHIDQWDIHLRLPYKMRPRVDSVEEGYMTMTCGQDVYEKVALEKFGISPSTFAVFIPNGQKYVHDFLPQCNSCASKEKVLGMLRIFCDLVDDGKISID